MAHIIQLHDKSKIYSKRKAPQSSALHQDISMNYVSSVGPNDVLSGRGPIPARNEGNKRFRLLIRSHRHAYTSGKRQEKQKLAHDILDEIHSRGGKFLKPVEDSRRKGKVWIELDEDRGLTKVKQALRESRDGEWWEEGSENIQEDRAEMRKPPKKRRNSVRHKPPVSASQPNIIRDSLMIDTLTAEAVTSPTKGGIPESPTSPLMTFLFDSEYANATAVDPRLLLFRDQIMLPHQSVDTVPAKLSPPTFFTSPWDCPGTNPRKSNITSTHEHASEETSIDFLMQDMSLSPTKSDESPSDQSGCSPTKSDESPLDQSGCSWDSSSQVPMSETESMNVDTQEHVKLNPSPSEDDIAAFLLSSLSITDRPVITEEEEALERASLSIKEKAKILSDALGLYPAVHHKKKARTKMDRKSTAFLIRLMKAEIEKIPREQRLALVEAQNTCGIDEFSDERLEMFLQAEGMNTKLAAQRLVNYWEARRNVFGDEKFTLPMTLRDALRDDFVALRAGVYRLLPKKDSFGRPLGLLEVARHSLNGYTSESLLRAIWYVFELAAQECRDGVGAIQLVWFKGASLFDYDLKVYDNLAYFMSSCFPVKILASHLCCMPRIFARVVKPIIHSFMSKDLRARSIMHDVPESELLDVLSNYGINKDMLPTQMGGTLVLDQEEWIAKRRADEMEEI